MDMIIHSHRYTASHDRTNLPRQFGKPGAKFFVYDTAPPMPVGLTNPSDDGTKDESSKYGIP
jgi:hypothetical protein